MKYISKKYFNMKISRFTVIFLFAFINLTLWNICVHMLSGPAAMYQVTERISVCDNQNAQYHLSILFYFSE